MAVVCELDKSNVHTHIPLHNPSVNVSQMFTHTCDLRQTRVRDQATILEAQCVQSPAPMRGPQSHVIDVRAVGQVNDF